VNKDFDKTPEKPLFVPTAPPGESKDVYEDVERSEMPTCMAAIPPDERTEACTALPDLLRPACFSHRRLQAQTAHGDGSDCVVWPGS